MGRRRNTDARAPRGFAVIVLALGLVAAACAPAPAPSVDPVNPPVLRYVALGDSYTIGTSVAEEERWPEQLIGRLEAAPPPAATLVLVANHAVNGYTSADVIAEELPRLDGDGEIGFVSLLIGVNDVVQGVPEETYEANVETILAAVLDRVPANRVICVETPDYTVTPQGASFGDPVEQRAGIARTNEILRERCEAADIAYVGGIFAISGDVATDPALVASDGLHPSGAQYRRWVIEQIEPAVRELLSAP